MRFDPVKAGVFSYWFIRWTNGCSRRWQFDTRPASSSSSSFNCHIHPPRLVTITSQKPIQHHLSNLPSSTSWLRRCRWPQPIAADIKSISSQQMYWFIDYFLDWKLEPNSKRRKRKGGGVRRCIFVELSWHLSRYETPETVVWTFISTNVHYALNNELILIHWIMVARVNQGRFSRTRYGLVSNSSFIYLSCFSFVNCRWAQLRGWRFSVQLKRLFDGATCVNTFNRKRSLSKRWLT